MMCIGKSFDVEGLMRYMYLIVEFFKRNFWLYLVNNIFFDYRVVGWYCSYFYFIYIFIILRLYWIVKICNNEWIDDFDLC